MQTSSELLVTELIILFFFIGVPLMYFGIAVLINRRTK